MDTRLMVTIVALIIGVTIIITSLIYMYNFRIVEVEHVKQRLLQSTI